MQMIVDGTTLAISTAEEVLPKPDEQSDKFGAAAMIQLGQTFEPTHSEAWKKDGNAPLDQHGRSQCWRGGCNTKNCQNMLRGSKKMGKPPMQLSDVCLSNQCSCCNACREFLSPSTKWQYVVYMRAADDQPLERFASEESQHNFSRSTTLFPDKRIGRSISQAINVLRSNPAPYRFGMVGWYYLSTESSLTQVSNGTVVVFTPYEDGGKGSLYFKTYGVPAQRITGLDLPLPPQPNAHQLKHWGPKEFKQFAKVAKRNHPQGRQWSQGCEQNCKLHPNSRSFINFLSTNRRPGSFTWDMHKVWEPRLDKKVMQGPFMNNWLPDMFYNDRIWFRDGMLVIPTIRSGESHILIKRGDNDFEIMKQPSATRDKRTSLFGHQIKVRGETVITNDPHASTYVGLTQLPDAGSVFMSKAAGHLETITSSSLKAGDRFGTTFDYFDSKLVASFGKTGGGAELIINGTHTPVFQKETVSFLYLDLPETMTAEELATTMTHVNAAGFRREFKLDAAVSRAQELTSSPTLNCTALNADFELQTLFDEWEVDKVNGLPDFSKRVTGVIEATGWVDGAHIPKRTLQFQFLKKAMVLKNEAGAHLGSLGKNLICLLELRPSNRVKMSDAQVEKLQAELHAAVEASDFAAALHLQQQLIAGRKSSGGNTGATNCCTRKLLSVRPKDRASFVAHLKLW